MHPKNTVNHIIYPVLWVFLPVALAIYILFPGLSGPFLLDDIPNLEILERWPNESIPIRFLAFLHVGDSGPTGRPVSLTSFFINDQAWPSAPYSHKYTNLLLHVLNSVLVFWFIWKLILAAGEKSRRSGFIAMTVATIWAIHPLQASTVFYVIQRMTILSTTFTLLALITYLYARQSLLENNIRKSLLLSMPIPFFALAGIYSKENAALLFLYILVTEYFFFQRREERPWLMKQWLILFAILPSALLIISITYMGLSSDGYTVRPFDLPQRLYSEARALIDYLSLIIFPRLGGLGIFHDDFTISKNLFDPGATFISVLLVALLPIIAVIGRYKVRLAAFAIFWFYCGHIMESTVLPLELYFEHRNYLPMLGILIGMTCFLFRVPAHYRRYSYTLLVIYIAMAATLSTSNASLWGNAARAATVWVKEHPDSIRARLFASEILYSLNSPETRKMAGDHINYLYENRDEVGISTLALLYFECQAGIITPAKASEAIKKLKQVYYYGHFSETLTNLEAYTYDEKCPEGLDMQSFHDLLKNIKESPGFNRTYRWNRHLIHRMESRIFASQRDLQKTMESLEQAYAFNPAPDIRLMQASFLISAGLYQEAAAILDTMPDTFGWLDEELNIETIDAFKEIIQKHQQKTN